MPEPFLGNEGRAQKPAPGDVEPAGVLAANAHRARALLACLAGHRLEEFALPVARHTGNADHLPSGHRQPDVAKPDRERARRFTAQPAHFEQWLACAARRGFAHDRLNLVANHHPGERGGRLLARVAMVDHLAVPHHRGPVAQPLHLVEAMRDVEDRLAFGAQAFERLEELVGLLRRQH